ncbi:AsmA family protein [Roseimaritima ulvae]|uniref:hypothetical protein n=1 Tax=Roseimaritima ulvae TaxID=980254 RepID=UPI0011CD3FB6|nr:hypothetical protein [Roseimaritima ulvae]
MRQRTQLRRGQRLRRKRTMVLVGGMLLAVVTLALPSIASQLGLGHGVLSRSAAEYGWQVNARSLQFGWITPLQLHGVEVVGASGETKAYIESIETNLQLMDCLGALSDLGQVTVRGVQAEMAVAEGRSSLEEDLAALFESDSSDAAMTATIEVHDVNLTVTDVDSGTAWFAGNIRSTVAMKADKIEVQASSVVTDPSGANGALELGAVLAHDPQSLAADQPAWQADLRMRSLPLHGVTLVKRRFPERMESLPRQMSGDASGVVHLTQYASGMLAGRFEGVEVRKLVAADPRLGERTWKNEFASLQGSLVYQQGVVQTQQLYATSDFGSVTMTGTVPLPDSSILSLAWVETISGQGTAEIELAKLDQAAPGLLPLRSGATITAGQVTAKIESGPSPDGFYRTHCSLRSTPVRGRASGRPIVLDPLNANATMVLRNGVAKAERIELSSAFGSASGQGDLRSGTGQFDVDFSRLASMLQPLVELPDAGLRGTAKGNIGWAAGAGNQWKLNGDLQAKGLNVQLPGGQTIRQPSLVAHVDAAGVWAGDTLAELNQLAATMRGDGQTWEATLLSPVREPAAGNPLPLKIKGRGSCLALVDLVQPWMPAELHSIDGSFASEWTAQVTRNGGRLTAAAIDLERPRGAWNQQLFTQPYMKIRFGGDCDLTAGSIVVDTLTVEGEAVTLAVTGRSSAASTELELGWRMDLQRMQNALLPTVAQAGVPTGNVPGRIVGGVQRVNYVGPPAPASQAGYRVYGRCEGSATLHGQDDLWSIDTDASAANLVIMQSADPATANLVGPVRGPQTTSTIWAEPTASVRGVFRYDANTGGAIADQVQIASEWLNTTVDGHVIWNEMLGEISLKGPSEMNMPIASQRLSTLTGQTIQLEGTHIAPLDILMQRQSDGQLAVDVRGSIGWQQGSLAGIRFGASTAELKVTETATQIAPTTIPMDLGQLHLNGQVHYGQDGLWIEQQPGRFAENIRLEPEMARNWLKYLAPLAADATEVAGTVSVDLSRCVIVPDDAARSRVVGQLSVQGAELNAGPLANQVIAGVDQLKSLSRGQVPSQPVTRTRRFLTMPAQVVEFELRDAVVSHQRMYFTIDDARLLTSGSVAIDGRLNLVAQVPLDAAWLGSDVQSLAGETVTLPIAGTLSRPSLNTAGIAQTVSEMALKAGQQTAENYLQQQMNRGIDKLFGR